MNSPFIMQAPSVSGGGPGIATSYNAPVVRSVGLGESGSAVTSGVITAPTGIQDDDLLFLQMTWDDTVSAVTLPSGFTSILTVVEAANNLTVQLAYKVASSEAGNYSISWTGAQEWTGQIIRIEGVDPASPIMASASTAGSGAAASFPAPSVTTTLRNALVLHLFGVDNDDSDIQEPADEPWQDELISRDIAGASGPTAMNTYIIKYSPGATGIVNATADGSSNEWVTATVALSPMETAADGAAMIYDEASGGIRNAGDRLRVDGGSVVIGRFEDSGDDPEIFPPRGLLTIYGGGSGDGPEPTRNAGLYMASAQATGTYIELTNTSAGGKEWNIGSWGADGSVPGSWSVFDHDELETRIRCFPDGSVGLGRDVSDEASSNLHISPAGIVTTNSAYAGAVVALTDGATPALDASLGNTFTLTTTTNPTIAVPSNPTDGQKIIIEILASGGTRDAALNTGAGGFLFGSTITALTTIASGKTDVIGAIYSGGLSKWLVTEYVKGF